MTEFTFDEAFAASKFVRKPSFNSIKLEPIGEN